MMASAMMLRFTLAMEPKRRRSPQRIAQRESQSSERREVAVGATGVSEGVEQAREEPEDAGGEDDPAEDFLVCQVACADEQEKELHEGYGAAYARMAVQQR